ncbi:uncharacterized protein M421DRAFT_95180 [Didymella exigua CBS 183.55]|uniref:RING-type domain-containing protein n=1 Tax=Didymella exigua CBS 183.55 TaxID=1150837 RepID=A0A6A5RGW1_9PLEO|nr:uncharacterized protein M421DRAFT_95180 [Didymella exigua CBS 183.55]KAF1924847.1 hypothetical protein M421DRAFT_95180 [Didymella exigua CBS 183.55]
MEPSTSLPMRNMFDFTVEDWIIHLETRCLFDHRPWMLNPSVPHYKTMQIFQAFTDRVIAALRRNDDAARALLHDDKLLNICAGLPCFDTEGQDMTFRKWIKEAILKYPHRRTPKQHLWLFIVDLQEATPTGDIVLAVQQAVDCLDPWMNSAWDTENLLVDPDDRDYFFHSEHTVEDAVGERCEINGSCPICANDFDEGIHRPQQGRCGHVYCRQCFQNTLKHAMKTAEAKYTCAFCLCEPGQSICFTSDSPFGLLPVHYWTLPLALTLLLVIVLLRLFPIARAAPTSLVLTALFSRLKDGITYENDRISSKLAGHMPGSTDGGARTRSAMRVAAVLRQIRTGSAFGTFDHCDM